ncbi:hypothetical protein BDR26DRAFT_865020 [Obelidium mucronatum]|nr:hypothetical protein BDR26DRAFT_865020 [Obelidium mucronatum]
MQQDPMIVLQVAYEFLIDSWADAAKQETVRTTWLKLDTTGRRDLIAKISPQAPESQQDPSAIVDGKKANLSGLVSLLPELCIADIIQKDNLLSGIDAIVKPGSFSAMAGTQLHSFVRPGLMKGMIQFTPQVPFNPSSFVAIYSNADFGKIFTLTGGSLDDSPKKKEMMELYQSGRIVTGPEYEALVVRIKLLIETCVLAVQELQGIPGRLNFVPTPVFNKGECRRCKKTQREDGKLLMKCVRCGEAEYCSKECQVQDWKVGGHKLSCVASQ